MQGPLDKSILDVLDRMGWLVQILHDDYLKHLCLNSLRELRSFVEKHADDAVKAQVGIVDSHLEAEQERERKFYTDECNLGAC